MHISIGRRTSRHTFHYHRHYHSARPLSTVTGSRVLLCHIWLRAWLLALASAASTCAAASVKEVPLF